MPSGQLVESDYVSAQYLHGRPSRQRATAYVVVVVALCAVAVWAARQAIYMLLGGIGGGLVGFAFVYVAIVPWRAKRVFRQQKNLHSPFDVEWDQAGLLTRNANGEVRTPWGDFMKWKENNRVFLLYHSDVLFQLVPKSMFGSDGKVSEFRGMLIQRIKKS